MAGKTLHGRIVRQVTVHNLVLPGEPGQVATAVFERWDKGIHTSPTRRDFLLTEARAMRLTQALYHRCGVPGRFRPFLALGFGWVWERT